MKNLEERYQALMEYYGGDDYEEKRLPVKGDGVIGIFNEELNKNSEKFYSDVKHKVEEILYNNYNGIVFNSVDSSDNSIYIEYEFETDVEITGQQQETLEDEISDKIYDILFKHDEIFKSVRDYEMEEIYYKIDDTNQDYWDAMSN